MTTTGSPLLTAPIGRTIVRLAAPNMIAMVVTMITLIAEGWYVGQLGTTSLAGLALAAAISAPAVLAPAGVGRLLQPLRAWPMLAQLPRR